MTLLSRAARAKNITTYSAIAEIVIAEVVVAIVVVIVAAIVVVIVAEIYCQNILPKS
jgi:hypothetical protein